MTTFDRGTVIVRRNVHRDGQVAAVETARVVCDDARGLLTWTADGSQVMHRTTLAGESIRRMPVRRRDATPTMLRPTTWHGTSLLVLTPPASTFSVCWFFDGTGEFLRWYVNLESCGRRWSGGLDTTDHALDIVVQPDRTWRWKDEDELSEREGHPSYWTPGEAAAIRLDGERLIPLIECGSYPFDGTLTDFRPDPGWPPTHLPPTWDHAPADLAIEVARGGQRGGVVSLE